MRVASRLRNRRWIAVLLSLILGLGRVPASAQTQNRAGLVIRHGDGSVSTTCVRFGEPSITGLDLLNRSGVSVVAEVGGLGSAVCAIGGEGCAYPAQPCFCQCQGANCAYWNYLHLIDGGWRYSPIGAAGYTITDGAVDAWAWGDQATPPVYTIDQICADSPGAPAATASAAEPSATNAPTFVSTATDIPKPVPIAQVTDTPEPSAPTRPSAPTDVPAPTVAVPPEPSALIHSPQAELGSYALFAVVVVALGGWLIVNHIRRR